MYPVLIDVNLFFHGISHLLAVVDWKTIKSVNIKSIWWQR